MYVIFTFPFPVTNCHDFLDSTSLECEYFMDGAFADNVKTEATCPSQSLRLA